MSDNSPFGNHPSFGYFDFYSPVDYALNPWCRFGGCIVGFLVKRARSPFRMWNRSGLFSCSAKSPTDCPVARDQWGSQIRDRATIMMVGCCRAVATYSGNSLDTAIRAAQTSPVRHTVEFLKVGTEGSPAALRRLPGFLGLVRFSGSGYAVLKGPKRTLGLRLTVNTQQPLCP